MRTRVFLTALLTACAVNSSPVVAQDRAASECTGLAGPAAEIACLRKLLAEGRSSPVEGRSPAAPTAENPVGAEQLRRSVPATAANEQEDSSRRLTAAVVEVRRDRRGLFIMRLDNGQIWRQDEGFSVRVHLDESAPIPVEIIRSGFGGYRMRFPEMGRRIVVSRLK